MSKIMYIWISILVVSAVAAFVYWEHTSQDLQTRARPGTVPQNAVWKGGLDGGSFFKCEENGETSSVSCRVFNEFTGRVELSATYDISPLREEFRPWNIEAFYEKISGFDGRSIYLLGSHELTPVH